MRPKKISFDKKAKHNILKGVTTIEKAVAQTMGAKGRNVIMEVDDSQFPTITNDGVTIAKDFYLSNRSHNLGCQALKQAAIRTNDVAGDGTTGSIVLASEMIRKAFEAIEEGANPVLVRKGMKDVVERVTKLVKKKGVKIKAEEEIKKFAKI